MKKIAFIILIVLLIISLVDSFLIRFYTPKQKQYSCYLGDFIVVDENTGDILDPNVFSVVRYNDYPETEVVVTPDVYKHRIIIDGKRGYVRIVCLAENSIPIKFMVDADGYERIPVPKEMISKLEHISKGHSSVNSDYMHNKVKLKKKSPNKENSQDAVPSPEI